jgi:small multidrug resistance pump
MNAYVNLAVAILTEIAGTTALKFVDGATNLPAIVVVTVGYGASFYFLSEALNDLPIGLIYATWSGFGILGIVLIGVVMFDEQPDMAGLVGMACIMLGVYLLNAVSGMSAH